MKLKLTLIPLLGASAILPLVAAQCTEQKDTNKPQTPSTDTQDKPSKPNPSTGSETSGGNTESNPSTSTPEKPNTDSNSGQSNPSDSQQGATTGGANSGNNTETNPTPGTDSSEGSDKKPGTNEGDKPSQGTTDSKNDSVTEAITILKKFANESTPIKTLMLTLKDNYDLIEKAIKVKFPKEDDVPYPVTEFMDLVKNLVTNYKIDQFDDETRKYMIPGSHGTTITKSQIVYKIKNILIPELSGEAAE
ncbi:hypothetical protein ACM0L0_02345 [Mycoplasma sp. 005V]|uniref:hypothetical protein n=1 Tax=Mycoplasma sp. 005V TaxID=3398776 RepID=UPI003A848DE0